MVEGPGCTLNGEKIRTKVQKGQKLKELRGSLLTSGMNPLRFFSGQFSGAETLGKELFMYFGPRALRVHFGMNGSMRINPAVRAETSGSSPVLEIHLTNDTVCFFDSTVEIRLTEDCEQRVKTLECLDVCSPRFSFSRSVDAVRSQRGRMLCDVLLDQAVMPGVGNIIKNEALFDSGLHPAVKVQQLRDEQIHHLVKMTRDFTLLFYKCRKSGSALSKHYKVYKRPRCGQCSAGVTVCRLGDNGRMTYFCERCQKADPSGVEISKLPVRNSLIGWAYSERANDSVATKQEEDWACELCTLVNQPAAAACDACLTPRPEARTDHVSTEAFTADLIKYPCIAFTKPPDELKVNWRSALGTTTLVFSDMSKKPKPAPPPLSPAATHLNSSATERGLYKDKGTTKPNHASGGWHKQSGERSNGDSLASYSHTAKKMRIDHSNSGPSNSGTSKTGATSRDSAVSPGPSGPCCASHRRPAVLRTVHKDGDNKGRTFYSCSLPRETKCDFFEWADTHFPFCHHGRRCLMRTVLKLGPNNGRTFYTCSSHKGQQCDFFQWAGSGPGSGPGSSALSRS